MKKYLIASVVALTVALVGVSVSAAFSSNLSVGSTGADVSALQSLLISKGFSIPSISSGAAQPGYFGQQTKTAVIAYQKSVSLPTTGFVGPLTRGVLNGSTVAVNPVSTCPAGYTCTVTPGTTPVVGTVDGITTPGIPGLMSVTAGPLSSSVLNVGTQQAPVLAIRVQAQYSDLDVQSLTLDLGNNTAVYNKLFNTVYVTDGSTVLASQPLNGSTVVQSGSEYILGIAGFHFFVPKGTYKDLIIKASLNSSIDSTYITSGASHYPTNAINGIGFSGWGIGLPSQGVRAVDGAGLNLYSNGTFYQTLTINQSLTDNAQANISLDPASPLAVSVPVTDTINNQYLGLPVLVFDVNAQNDTLHLHEVKVRFSTSGTGSLTAAYLYQGSTPIQSASVSNGVADFANINNGTLGAKIPVNTTLPYTVKVDVTGVTSAASPLQVTASTTNSDIIVYNSIDGNVSSYGVAVGNTQFVSSSGPLLTLNSVPAMIKQVTNQDQNGNATSTYTATFNIQAQSVGTDVAYGLLASSSPAFAISNAVVYQTIAGVQSTTTLAALGGSVTYNQPSNTALNTAGDTFTVARNGSVSLPVTYTFQVKNPGSNTYAVQLKQVNVAPSGVINFMNGQVSWRTNSI
jgi:peptidoglycan hydrolase-like protein with peptidoglycan-binding domain